MKVHWIRKHLDYSPVYNSNCWYYDWNSACGRNMLEVKHTCIRKIVTCKTCLKIMNKEK